MIIHFTMLFTFLSRSIHKKILFAQKMIDNSTKKQLLFKHILQKYSFQLLFGSPIRSLMFKVPSLLT